MACRTWPPAPNSIQRTLTAVPGAGFLVEELWTVILSSYCVLGARSYVYVLLDASEEDRNVWIVPDHRATELHENTDCYLVAYYVRPARPFGTAGVFFSADYHFVRRDSDGNWSHKPATQEATRKQYKRPDPTVPEDPAKPDGTYTGDDITDPPKDSVGPGYQFCGYLCVCGASVRVAQADIPQTGRQSQGAIIARGTAQASTARVIAVLTGTDFVSLLEELTTRSGAAWRPGYGEGQLRYRLDVGDRGAFTEFSLLVNDRSLTAWDGSARTLADPKGRLARLIDAWLERRVRPEPALDVACPEYDAPQREQEADRRDPEVGSWFRGHLSSPRSVHTRPRGNAVIFGASENVSSPAWMT